MRRAGNSAVNLSDPTFWAASRETRSSAFKILRDECPVSGTHRRSPGRQPVIRPHKVTGLSLVTQIFAAVQSNPATFISGEGVMIFDNLPPDVQFLYEGWIGSDAPRHTALRRVVASAFTPRMVKVVQQHIEQQARAAVSRIGSLDLRFLS